MFVCSTPYSSFHIALTSPLSLSFHFQGHYLAESKVVETILTSEFKLIPLEGARGSTIPYNVDGAPIHVRVLHQRLRVFCLEPVSKELLERARRRSCGEVLHTNSELHVDSTV